MLERADRIVHSLNGTNGRLTMPTNPAVLAEQALADLRAGRVTDAVVAAVTRAATALARTRTATTPSGSWEWSAHDIDDLVGDFFEVRGRAESVAGRVPVGVDDEVKRFRAALQRALRQLIIDRYRATPRGALDRRVERRMRKRDDIAKVAPSHWSFHQHRDLPHWAGDDDVLVGAVQGVTIDPPPAWPEDSDRQPPSTTTGSVDATCDAILGTAACPVEKRTVCTVVVDRVIPFDGNDVSDRGVDVGEAGPAALSDAAEAAAEAFWDALNDDERKLLPLLRTPARQLEADGVLGLKKSALAARQATLEARVVEFAQATRDGIAACRHVLDRQAAWAAGQNKGGAP